MQPARPKTLAGKLTISVQSAKDLKNADLIGKSDPFVRLYIASEGKQLAAFKTKTIDNNLNPKWKEKFHYLIPAGTSLQSLIVTFVVFDEDPGEDEFLGQVVMNVDPNYPFGKDEEVKLEKRTSKDSSVKGKLCFSIDLVASDVTLADTSSFPTFRYRGRPFKKILGPILHFRGTQNHQYKVAVVVVAEGDGGDRPDLEITPPPVADEVNVKKLLSEGNRNVWVYEFAIQQLKVDLPVKYFLCGKAFTFYVPGTVGCTFRAVSTSCNGFHDEAEKKKLTKPEFNLYSEMKRLHDGHRFLVNLAGGDQLYSDPVWKLPGLNKYFAGDQKVVGVKFTAEMDNAVNKFYMDNYISSWGSAEMSEIYGSVANCMTWDDHDIFDGWGSYPNDIQQSDIYQGIWKHAERYYAAFQLGCTLDKLPPTTLPGKHHSKTQMYTIGDVAIASLDLRTERALGQVCRPETYECLKVWLDAPDHSNFSHLIVVSSIPICYNDFSTVEAAMGVTGGEMLDDLLDHWRAKDHQKERKVLIKLLFDFAEKTNTRVTIISGDVHIAATGAMHHKKLLKKSNAGEINCLITSAIVNAPPPEAFVSTLSLSAGTPEHIDKKVKSGLCKFLPKKKWYYIPNRNFLVVEETAARDLFCRWVSESPIAADSDNILVIAAWAQGAKPDQVIEDESALTTLGNMAHHAVTHIGK